MHNTRSSGYSSKRKPVLTEKGKAFEEEKREKKKPKASNLSRKQNKSTTTSNKKNTSQACTTKKKSSNTTSNTNTSNATVPPIPSISTNNNAAINKTSGDVNNNTSPSPPVALHTTVDGTPAATTNNNAAINEASEDGNNNTSPSPVVLHTVDGTPAATTNNNTTINEARGGGNNNTSPSPVVLRTVDGTPAATTNTSGGDNNNTSPLLPVVLRTVDVDGTPATTTNNNMAINETSGDGNNNISPSPVVLHTVDGTPAAAASVPPANVRAAAAAASSKKRSEWDTNKVMDADVARLQRDGRSILCDACLGVGKNRGKVNMRHPFSLGAWDDHCNGKKHKVAVANMRAEKEKDNPMKNKKQAGMSAFFKVIKKKKGKDAPEPASATASPHVVNTSASSTVVDPTRQTEPSSCAGAYNAFSGKQRKNVALYTKYVAPLESQTFRVGSYAGVPSLHSRECTRLGLHEGLDGGSVCGPCQALRAEKGSRNPSTTLNKWAPNLLRCIERRQKDVLTSSDFNDAQKFAANKRQLLTPAGQKLKDEAKAQVEYGSYMSGLCKRLPAGTFKAIGEDSTPGLDKFIGDITDVWKSNPDFRSSLQVGIIKCALARAQSAGGNSNARIDESVLNFVRFMIMRTYDKKAAAVFSTAVFGPSERWCAEMDARERKGCIVNGGEDRGSLSARIDSAIERRLDNGGATLTFSIAIDATKVAQNLEVSSGFRAILGAEYPNHFIGIDGKSKEEIKNILDGSDEMFGKLREASEIKVALLTFQGSPPGVPVSEIVAARPQSNNESNDFIKEIELAASSATTRNTKARFSNIAVDGVSCESEHVWRIICQFLSCITNHLGTTDPNHNAKSWRYQVIAGGGILGVTIGFYMVDAYLLRLAGVAMDLWRPNDFAADLPVLKLTSFATIQKLSTVSLPFGSTSEGDRGVLALTLFFIRLHLHAVNGKSVPARHRVVYLWSSMVWLTSLSGASIITKRNLVAEVISFVFIVMCSDITKPRYASSEPVEHFFGQLRTMIREFTVLEFAQLVEKLTRRLEKMYKYGFRSSRDPEKGYQSTFRNYFNYSTATDQSEALMEGTIQIQLDGDYVANQLWSVVSDLITFSSNLMGPFLSTLGVTNDDRSPFCRTFVSLIDLRNEFIGYLPHTFDFDNVRGTGDGGNPDDSDGGGDDMSSSPADLMLQRIVQLQRELTGASEDDDDTDELVDGVDGSESESTVEQLPETTDEYAQLMNAFRAILTVSDGDEILPKVLAAASQLEGKDVITGAVSFSRKAKSLLERWLAKSVDSVKGGDALTNNEVIIERDTIVLVHCKVGSGASAATVACPFRVVNIYEKYYNKWFMSKENFKRWKGEAKPYKLEIRMMKKNAINEYTDVKLSGESEYGRGEICKIVEDSSILSVVGKMQQVVA